MRVASWHVDGIINRDLDDLISLLDCQPAFSEASSVVKDVFVSPSTFSRNRSNVGLPCPIRMCGAVSFVARAAVGLAEHALSCDRAVRANAVEPRSGSMHNSRHIVMQCLQHVLR